VGYPTICRELLSDDRPHPPERRLCAAVLMQAIKDVLLLERLYEWKEQLDEQEQSFWWLFVAQEGQARLSAQFCCQVVEYELADVRLWLWKHHRLTIEKQHNKYVKRYGQYV